MPAFTPVYPRAMLDVKHMSFDAEFNSMRNDASNRGHKSTYMYLYLQCKFEMKMIKKGNNTKQRWSFLSFKLRSFYFRIWVKFVNTPFKSQNVIDIFAKCQTWSKWAM